jgi:hypothetical protein
MEMLKANSTEVTGGVCGHDWFLADWEIMKIRKRIATGAL